jgi:uncharacterized radical SAM superfamily protein
MNDPIDKKIEELVLDGVLEVAGMDLESGEPLYNFTNKLKDYNEELYKIHNNYFFQDLTNLWEKGFINIDFLEDDPTVTLTDKASNENEVDKLDKEEKQSLNEIKRISGES